MRIYISSIILIILSIILNIFNKYFFYKLLSLIWYIASILIIYLAIYSSIKYKFINLNIKKIISAIKSKSNNNIKPLSSLCLSLAAKIGVGSLSGIALAVYYGGVGTIFWIMIVSLFISINSYTECLIGMKYREKINNKYYGGPSYYIKKCLGNKKISLLYSILVIISYGFLFLSIQSNTIINVTNHLGLPSNYAIIILFIITLLIIRKGLTSITKVNSILVPTMLLLYFIIGIFVIIANYKLIPIIFLNVIKESFNLKSIIPVFLIGMQRAIFITESSIGTSAISASSCDNNPEKQGLLEVLGIDLTIFLVCFTTFIIIVTSNYNQILFSNLNGIEIVLYAFNYHFGNIGSIILSVITIMFALSTIISSYFFGENNLLSISHNKIISIIYKILFSLVIVFSYYFNPKSLWNLTDYFIALLVIINVLSIMKISHKIND